MSRTKIATTDKKRHGQHKQHTHSYKKVYWPYLPMLVTLLVVLVMGSVQPQQIGRVLGFASQIDEKSLLEATNQQRVKHGFSDLELNQQLSEAAQAKAEDMSNRNYWSHETPEGDLPWVFLDKAEYTYHKAGENLAYGFLSSSTTVAGWMNSPSHRANLLDQGYTDVGFGIAHAPNYLGQDDQTIIVAFYAVPASLAIVEDTKATSVAGTSSAAPRATNDFNPTNYPASASTTFISALTKGNTPWITFLVGTTTGVLAAALLIRHGVRLKRMIHQGEVFIMHHPVLDLTFTFVIAIGVILSQSVGFIR